MFTSFSTALSALNANSTAVSVVGNNLANLNTPGYKTSVVYFRDLVTRSIGAGLGVTQVGFGTAQPTTIREFSQGAVQASSGSLDAAIQGDGFFIVKEEAGEVLYTRAGNFHTDAVGRLLTNTGQRVQGWTLDPVTGLVNTNNAVSDIAVPVGSLKPPIATKTFTFDLNLNSNSKVTGDADLSYPIQVFDTLGQRHVLTVDFTKTDEGEWDYGVTLPGEDLAAGTPGTPSVVATGTLTFDEMGKLADPDADSPIEFTVAGLASGSDDMELTWDPYNAAGSGRITQYAESSGVSASSQDGYGAAQLMRVGLSDGGLLVAQFSDEQQMVVGQLAMAAIRNPDTLTAAGNNNFQVSSKSSTPVIGVSGTGGRGKIVGASIEASTVDIATEFTNLIVYQRAYQANSRVVTSADQISQETINLIR
jgi:flagellar hook protein FlgE